MIFFKERQKKASEKKEEGKQIYREIERKTTITQAAKTKKRTKERNTYIQTNK